MRGGVVVEVHVLAYHSTLCTSCIFSRKMIGPSPDCTHQDNRHLVLCCTLLLFFLFCYIYLIINWLALCCSVFIYLIIYSFALERWPRSHCVGKERFTRTNFQNSCKSSWKKGFSELFHFILGLSYGYQLGYKLTL